VSTVCTYVGFLTTFVLLMRLTSDYDSSMIMSIGSGVQCLGYFLLLQKVNKTKSVAGISSKMLEMFVCSMVFRLTSTVCNNGYLPVDRSGDWAYQLMDVASLLLVIQLLWKVHKEHEDTYQGSQDTLEIWRAVPAAIAMGMVLHGRMNRSLFFDISWMVSVNVETIALLPQYWMLVKQAGEVEALTSHFIACIAVSRVCSTIFWWYAFVDLRSASGSDHVGWYVLGSHALQVIMSADFMYHYVKSRMKKVRMVIPDCALDI